MDEYRKITPEEAFLYRKEELIQKYNETVEEIYHLQYVIARLTAENDAWMSAYEEVSDEFYG